MTTPFSLSRRSPNIPTGNESLAFWNNWPGVYRRLFFTLSVVAIALLCYLWVAALRSPAPVLTPLHLQQLEPLEVPIRHFNQGLIPFTINAETYVIFERVLGSALQPSPFASYCFLVSFLLALVILSAVLTTLTRFWFFIGSGLLILILASLRLDSLHASETSVLPFALVALGYAGTGYYFVFIKPSSPFSLRCIVFFLITVLWVTSLSFLATVPQPLIHLAAHGLVAGTIITFIFIFSVAHEIIAAFIYAVSSGEKPVNSLRHFLIITTIYLINLGMLLADKKHLIRWDYFPESLFFLFSISAIVGVWGFRQREPQYESFLKANPFGVYLYVALAGIALGTISYVLASANDPVIQLLKDGILYAHLGYGIIFFAYIISNFFPLLGENLAVYKVLYKPTTMPYFTFRLAGLIATFAFFAYANWRVSVNQLYAGHYNAMGDLYLTEDTTSVAESYYRRSIYYATRNYHAHYALAQIFGLRGEEGNVKEEYDNLAYGRPLDLGYLNWSQLYENDNANQKAATILKEGLKDFPGNGFLQNALSLLSAKLGNVDSAIFLAASARNSGARKEAETNLTGLLAKYRPSISADSIMKLVDASDPAIKNNLLALSSFQKKSFAEDIDPGKDTLLDVYRAASLNNNLIDRLDRTDTSFIAKVVVLARKPSNIYFRDFLIPSAALACYEKGMTGQAFKLLRGQAFQGRAAKDYDALGVWAIEQGAPLYAVHFLDEASNLNWPGARFHRAVALTEGGDYENALTEWAQLESGTDKGIQALASKMRYLLTCSGIESLALSNQEKYAFSRLRLPVEDQVAWKQFVSTITDDDYKAKAILDRCKKLEELGETKFALDVFEGIKSVKLTDKLIYQEVMRQDLRFLAKQEQWPAIGQRLSAVNPADKILPNDRLYLQALMDEQAGKTKEATEKFNFLVSADPFDEDAVLASIRFLDKQGQNNLKSFAALVYAMDTNPDSPKYLKAHALQAWRLGFDDAVRSSMDRLKTLIPRSSFEAFLQAHPDIFQVTPH